MVANFVNRTNVRMIQRRRSPRFTPETLQRLRVICQGIGKKLKGDEAAELKVFGLINHTHPAVPDFLQDAVMRNRLAKDGLGVRHGAATS
jgi:hypothetical protein